MQNKLEIFYAVCTSRARSLIRSFVHWFGRWLLSVAGYHCALAVIFCFPFIQIVYLSIFTFSCFLFCILVVVAVDVFFFFFFVLFFQFFVCSSCNTPHHHHHHQRGILQCCFSVNNNSENEQQQQISFSFFILRTVFLPFGIFVWHCAPLMRL